MLNRDARNVLRVIQVHALSPGPNERNHRGWPVITAEDLFRRIGDELSEARVQAAVAAIEHVSTPKLIGPVYDENAPHGFRFVSLSPTGKAEPTTFVGQVWRYHAAAIVLSVVTGVVSGVVTGAVLHWLLPVPR